MSAALELKDIVSPLATLISALGGFGGVIFTLVYNRKSQDRQRAFDAYNAYLKECFDHPDLATGRIDIPEKYGDGTKRFFQYEWFVARLLSAAEQILDIAGDDVEWKKTIKVQLEKHAAYLSCRFFKPDMYSLALSPIIAAAINSRAKAGTSQQ